MDAWARVDAAAGPEAEKLLHQRLRQLPGFRDLTRDGTMALLKHDLFRPGDPDRATAVIWLRVGPEQVGLLILSRPRTIGWTDGELVATRAFADQVALALVHAQAEHNRHRLASTPIGTASPGTCTTMSSNASSPSGWACKASYTCCPTTGPPTGSVDTSATWTPPITDIRNTIFSLQHKPYGGKRSLRDDLLVIVDDAADALRFHPQVTMTGPIDGAIPTHLSDDALATLRESLSNVARHAQASRVEVLVTVDEAAKTLTVRVDDNGIGIPEATKPRGGLRNMAVRAQTAGGHTTTVRTSEPGTSVTWVVPLAV